MVRIGNPEFSSLSLACAHVYRSLSFYFSLGDCINLYVSEGQKCLSQFFFNLNFSFEMLSRVLVVA